MPLGSNRHWSLSLLCASVLSVAGIVSLRYLLTPAAIPAAIGGCRLFIVLLVLWALFPVVQLAPVPAAFEVLAGDDVLSAYRGLGAIRGDVTAHLSVDLDATLRGLLRQTTFVSVFMLVLILIDNASRLRVLMTMMLVTGAGQALYGLMVYLGGSELGLWSPGHTTEAVTGTYVNQNHFAGLMELTLPAGIGLAFGTFSRGEFSFARRPWLRTLLAGLLSRNLVILFAVFLMLSALILTASRGAIVALCVGVLSALAIGLRARDAVRPVLRIGLAFLVMALIAMLWFGPGSLGAKIGRLGVDSGRADLRATSYELIAKNPWLGTGTGTFRWMFPRYKDERFGSGYYEHAHNDYLELLIEQGVVGFSLLAAAVLGMLGRIARICREHRNDIARGAAFASLSGCTSLLVHGLVDFNLQIPANAAYFFALLALGLAAGGLPSQSEDGPCGSRRKESPGPLRGISLAAVNPSAVARMESLDP